MTPGLFGKMPAHGDFVRRGWDDATVDALDRWCSEIAAAMGEAADDGSPVVRGRVPAGRFGSLPLQLTMARSRDRAGRDFVLVVGVAGDGAWPHQALTAALRAALTGEHDADATLAAIGTDPADGDEATGAAGWWCDDVPVTVSDTASVAALLRDRTTA